MYLDSSLQTIGPKIPSEKLILNYWRKKILLKTNYLYDTLVLLHNFNVVIWQLAYIALFSEKVYIAYLKQGIFLPF